jgi:tyrosinase
MSNALSRRSFAALTGTAAVSLMMRDLAAHDGHGATPAATPMASPVSSPVASPVSVEVIVRKNAKDLTSAEKKAFTDAVLALKAVPSPWDPQLSTYDQFVFWHREAFECDNMSAHMGPAFLPWHRAYLHLFEQKLREVDPSVTLPYWDWTTDQEIDSYLWQDDFMGGDGDPDEDFAVMTGPFRKGAWEITLFDQTDDLKFPHLIRHLGEGEMAPDLPTAAQVEEAMAIPNYDVAPWNEQADHMASFRNYIEGWRECGPSVCSTDGSTDYPNCTGSHDMHNRVHLWVSGEMIFAHEGGHEETPGPFGTMAWNSSPNDPVFFLHHANIDRLWNVWMERHGRIYEPESGAMHGHNLNDHMWPFNEIGMQVTPAMVLDSRAIGVVYDTDQE